MKALLESFNEFIRLLQTMQLADVIDILLVTFLVYHGIQMIRTSNTARIAKAVIFLLLLSWVTDLLEIHVLNYLLVGFWSWGSLPWWCCSNRSSAGRWRRWAAPA